MENLVKEHWKVTEICVLPCRNHEQNHFDLGGMRLNKIDILIDLNGFI